MTLGRLLDLLLLEVFERTRHHYLLVVPTVLFALTYSLMAVPGLLITARIVELSPAATRDLVLILGAAVALGLLTGVAASPRRTRDPIRAQLRRQPVDPAAVWEAAVRAPDEWTRRTAVATVLYGVVAHLVLALRNAELSFAGWAGLGALLLVGTALLTSLWSSVGRVLLRPVLEEVVRLEPRVAVPTGQRSIQSTVLASMAALTYIGLIAGAATVAAVADPPSRPVALTVVACLAAGWSALVAMVLTTRPLFAPLQSLTAATRRIGAGRLDTDLVPTGADEFADLMVAINEMQQGLRQRERLHAAFGSYVDPSLAERLLREEDPRFDGEEVDVTVLFLDVRDFTPYAEGVSARAALARLNRLFELVVPVVTAHGGHANKYLGDGLLAAFGAPEPHPDHADRALDAARRIAELVAEELGDELRVGIGLSTGSVIAGTVGGGGKLEFTLIGDAVNVASRVEELTKRTGDRLLFTQATLDASSLDPAVVLHRGMHELRGRSGSVDLYALAPTAGAGVSEATRAVGEGWEVEGADA